MGKLQSCFVVGILALAAACGDDGNKGPADAAIDSPPDMKIWMDAPPSMFDLTCVGNTAPTSATATITLSGTAQLIDGSGLSFDIQPISGGTVKACDTAACNGPADGSATTDAQGAWSLDPITTGGQPLTDYLKLDTTRPTLVYPPAPFIADQAGIPVVTFGPGAVSLIDNFCNTSGPLIAIAVTDCANMPITDATMQDIVVKQNGAPVTNPSILDVGSLPGVPAEAAGLFLVCDIPENTATSVGVTYNGMNFLAHDVNAANNTTTTTLVRPGY